MPIIHTIALCNNSQAETLQDRSPDVSASTAACGNTASSHICTITIQCLRLNIVLDVSGHQLQSFWVLLLTVGVCSMFGNPTLMPTLLSVSHVDNRLPHDASCASAITLCARLPCRPIQSIILLWIASKSCQQPSSLQVEVWIGHGTTLHCTRAACLQPISCLWASFSANILQTGQCGARIVL